MSVSRVLAGFAFCVLSRFAVADVVIDSNYLFVPVGFDSNDEVVVVIDGYLPSPCFQLADTRIESTAVDGKTVIEVIQEAREKSSIPFCPDVAVPFTKVVSLGTMAPGDYGVKTAGVAGVTSLSVAEAKVGTRDDFAYASVDFARVIVVSRNEIYAQLEGRMTNSCLELDEQNIEIILTDRTVQVLPKLKVLSTSPDGSPCKPIEQRFTVKKLLPVLGKGRFLVHIRTMDGQSHNLVFDPELNVTSVAR